MNLYALWPYFAVLTAVLLMISIDSAFKAIDNPARITHDRFATLDGLRGFLAFGVFGHHAAVTHGYLLTGKWELPPSAFYTALGEVGVSLFFMITGFLFWGKLLRNRGAPGWKKLYVGRFFRIAPVYLAIIAAMLVLVLARTDFKLQQPFYILCWRILRWLSLGILGQPDVNGYEHTGLLLAGVTWTLQYEWFYYFSLPLLAVFAKANRHLLFVFSGMASCLFMYALKPVPAFLYTSLFFCGMAAASLLHEGMRINCQGKLGVAVGGLCLWILFANFQSLNGIIRVILMGVFFFIVSSGNTFLGILSMKPCRRLGEISYSIYLIHGLVLTMVFSIGSIRDYALGSHVQYWLSIAFCALLVVCAASLSYLFIERPGMNSGSRQMIRYGLSSRS